ncbi:MAG: cation:proton antiporter [Candidatus Aquicultorales bacterium]
MQESLEILIDLFVVFIAAKIGGEIAERIKQPPVVGEVALGILIGSGVFGIGFSETTAVVSTIGAVLLLFMVGMETDMAEIRSIGWRAAGVAVTGIVVPFAAGFGFMFLRGGGTVESMFLATALVATSVGITARVLSDLGVIARAESQIILAAAVLDDVLGLLVLSMVTAFANSGTVAPSQIAIIVAKGVSFIILAAVVFPFIVGKLEDRIEGLRHRNALLSVALGACVGFSILAEEFGLAAIVGAFLAGMGFANVPGHSDLKRDVGAIGDFLVPLFFVAIGMQVDLGSVMDPGVLTIGIIVSVLAVLSKLIGCGVAAKGLGFRSAFTIGIGMVPRGEVGLIVATIGISIGAISKDMVSTIVIMSLLTTVIVPPVLPLLFGRREQVPEAQAV